MHKTITHEKCRMCHSANLKDCFSLGEQFVNDFVQQEKIQDGHKAPLDLVICEQCSLVQLRHTAPQELMYSRHYWYRSGVTQTMRDELADVARAAANEVTLEEGDLVLDIGANDGTFLANFADSPVNKIGCEPANNLIDSLASVADVVIHDFWGFDVFKQSCEMHGLDGHRAKLITALGMFYDLEDPMGFIADISKALADDGVFVAQLMCLESMLEQNDLGNICHEHLEFYSFDSLKYLFENNGLEIYKIVENKVNGGSYRIFARHFVTGSIKKEEKSNYESILSFKERIDRNKKACVSFIEQEVACGKTVYVYGASTKGNVILQYYGLDTTLITAAAERSPEKVGKYTIGSGIPIVSEDDARSANPDYFLVLPWAFFDEFYERESDWLSRGGKFIVPLPEFRVVGK